MTAARHLAILGGSSAFTPALAAGLADAAGDLPPLVIRLFGRDVARLESVQRFCDRIARARVADHRYEASTSVADAAAGCQLVINQVRVGGFQGRAVDETFPLRFGLPGDETIGPGGLASALRAVPFALAAAREVARRAPGALFLNLSNPLGIIVAAVSRVPGIRAVGLCELPAATLSRALALAGLTPESVDYDYVGLNHQGWFTRIEAPAGIDVLPALFAAIERDAPRGFGVDAAAMRDAGALPVSYLRLYAHTQREVAVALARSRPRGVELEDLAARLHAHYASTGDATLPGLLMRRDMPWIVQAVVPAIRACLDGKPAELYVSEPNRGYLPDLPDGAIVEKRCVVASSEIRPVRPVRPPPRAIAALVAELTRYEQAALEAALDPGRTRVLDALRAHPLSRNHPRLEELADAVLAAAGLAVEAGAR